MKLELKHLAAYLPYGVHVKYKFGRYSQTKNEPLEVDDLKTFKMFKIFKPILRPLSDLTKEIEYNGNTFIPIEELRRHCIDDLGAKDYDTDIGIDKLVKGWDVIYYPKLFLDKLLEWHFDVFGLIDAGLAIDINTLKK